jgi:acyl-CoA hydrolase
MKTKRVVTLKFSEVLFKKQVKLHDILEFRCRTVREGTTSLTVATQVVTLFGETSDVVCTAELIFVALDSKGKATPWKVKS